MTISAFCSMSISSVASSTCVPHAARRFLRISSTRHWGMMSVAGIGYIGCGVAICVHIKVPKDSGAVVAAEGKVKASVGKDLVDDSQVIQDFETAGLQPFSLVIRQSRSGSYRRSGF